MTSKRMTRKKTIPTAKPYDPGQLAFKPARDLLDRYAAKPAADPNRMRELSSCVGADTFSGSAVHSAVLQETFLSAVMPDMDINRLVDNLEAANTRIADGDLQDVEAMLYSQAVALNAMFTALARRGHAQEQLKQYQVHIGLALKAQSQCRNTLEALGNIKNPPNLSFIRQQNNANNQQVNNGQPTPAPAPVRGENANESNKQLEHHHGERLDTRATGSTIRDDSALEAVGTRDRAEDGEG